MNTRLFFACFLLLRFAVPLAAQDPFRTDLQPCATAGGVSPWLQQYLKNGPAVLERSDTLLTVGMQLHLVGKDDGTGFFPARFVLDAFCQLNTDFEAANVRFFFKNDWQHHPNSAWRNHADLPTGIDMMLSQNVPDALNVYFVGNPAGACGYNLPYAGIALAHGCLLDGEHTWAHEAGHALALPHPFLGWEGAVYDPVAPTPEQRLYDHTHFHETPDTVVPAPPDTALVERTGWINCALAADGFCDTPPDYLSTLWACDQNGLSLAVQKDPDGVEFRSDGTLFMSYAAPACQSRFTDAQIAAMRAFLPAQRPHWLGNVAPPAKITAAPDLLFPADQQTVTSPGVDLQWQPVEHATHYLVEIALDPGFFPVAAEIITTNTTHFSGPLSEGEPYYWRVRPFNAWDACTGWSEARQFSAAAVGTAEPPRTVAWRCYPTVLHSGQSVMIDTQGHPVYGYLYDALGRLRWQGAIEPRTAWRLPFDICKPGTYRLAVYGAGRGTVFGLTVLNL